MNTSSFIDFSQKISYFLESRSLNSLLIRLKATSPSTLKKMEVWIEQLENEPEVQGKPLRNELSCLLSVRAIGQRYRIIYKVVNEQVIVVVVAVGIRKERDRTDIYRIAERLLRSGLMTF